MDIHDRLMAFATLGAGWIMWVLVILSVIGLAIILERTYYFLSSRDDSRFLQEQLRKKLASGDLDGAKKLFAAAKSFQARIIHAGLSVADRGVEPVRERMSSESLVARSRMERNLAFLGTVGNNAPFVGLLGTVIGIINAFRALNESQGQVSTGLMQEIGEALIVTAIGLLVALPSVAAFNVFQRAIKTRMMWAQAMSADLIEFLASPKPDAGYRDEAE